MIRRLSTRRRHQLWTFLSSNLDTGLSGKPAYHWIRSPTAGPGSGPSVVAHQAVRLPHGEAPSP